MKYAITYGRKVRAAAYEMLEISMIMEFDETTRPGEAIVKVRDMVNHWIADELDRLLKESVPRPE